MKNNVKQKYIDLEIDLNKVSDLIVNVNDFENSNNDFYEMNPEEKALSYLVLSQMNISDFIKEQGIPKNKQLKVFERVQDALDVYLNAFITQAVEIVAEEDNLNKGTIQKVIKKKGRFLS